jgi:hypothetical protein
MSIKTVITELSAAIGRWRPRLERAGVILAAGHPDPVFVALKSPKGSDDADER